MTMHVPTLTPACHTTGPATPRAAWSHDQGRGCGNAADPETWARSVAITPGCRGCSRARHALMVSAGTMAPLPTVKTGAAP